MRICKWLPAAQLLLGTGTIGRTWLAGQIANIAPVDPTVLGTPTREDASRERQAALI